MATGESPKAVPSTAILDLFPCQGEWRDGDYFALPGNRLVESVRGHVEVLAVPSMLHQFLARLIFLSMHSFVESRGLGIVMSAPTRVKLADRHYREPDVLFVAARNCRRKQEQFWETIDLAVEIISPDDPERDLIDKRADYAAAGIAEYWIVDPRDDSVLALELFEGDYQATNSATRGASAASRILDGFQVDVRKLFQDARPVRASSNQWDALMRIVCSSLLTIAFVASLPTPGPGDTRGVVGRQLNLPQTPFSYTKVELPPHFAEAARSHDNTPLDNPITDDGATLGRVLFYDENLSRNGTVSCASCHKQELAFSDGQKLSVGFASDRVTRNSMSLVDARYYANGRFFWDERAATLEQQVLMPIENRAEMGHSLATLTAQLRSDPIYPPLFKAAFGNDKVSADRIAKALAQFIRSIVSYRSKYDEGRAAVKFVHDAFPNFTEQESEGKQLFLEQGRCAGCHLVGYKQEADGNRQSALFFLDRAAVNGVDGKVDGNDPGVGGHTGRRNELGAFKAPSLRNVALTAPYMHDGRFTTLNRVIEHYNWGVRPHPNLDDRLLAGDREVLPEREKNALIAFLETLTDHALIRDPRFADPFVRSEH